MGPMDFATTSMRTEEIFIIVVSQLVIVVVAIASALFVPNKEQLKYRLI